MGLMMLAQYFVGDVEEVKAEAAKYKAEQKAKAAAVKDKKK